MKYKTQAILTGLLLLFHSFRLASQEIPERVIHYRMGDWITYPVTRFVTSITLGHRYVYFGTAQGISRYDFYENRWDYPYTVSNGLENDSIQNVFYDFNSGYLWCVTEAGLSNFIPAADEWRNISYDQLGFYSVSDIGSGNSHLWLVNGNDFYYGDRSGVFFQKATEEDAENDSVIWSGDHRMAELPDLFMDDGDFFFPEGYIQRLDLRRYDITDNYLDAFSNLWMGTWGLGGARANTKSLTLDLLPFGPYSSDIRSIAWDGNNLWIGGYSATEEAGAITLWDMDRNRWHYFESVYITELRSDRVRSVAADSVYVWFATDEGLSRYSKNEDRWRTFSMFENLWDNRITCVKTGRQKLWVGTESGVNVISPGMVIKKIRFKGLIHCFVNQLETDGADVWVATEQGIYYFSGQNNQWKWISGASNVLAQSVTAVACWGNEVWFGTDDGVEVYDKVKNEWRGFPSAHYPTEGKINTILVDDEVVWFGTKEGMLKYVKSENRFKRYSIEDGLPDNSVRWILPDVDYVWFGTGRGLTRFYWNAPYRVD